MIDVLIEKIEYEDHLRKTQEDFDERWENVQELVSDRSSVLVDNNEIADGRERSQKSYAVLVANEQKDALQLPNIDDFVSSRRDDPSSSRDLLDMEYKEDDGIFDTTGPGANAPSTQVLPDGVDVNETPLRAFLEASMLSTETEGTDKDTRPKVTISTIHGAKGLEWPVVFLPCVEQGTIPFYRSTEEDQIREERRLLYVAMTRAQASLTLTYSRSRMMAGQDMDRQLSVFVDSARRIYQVSLGRYILYVQRGPHFTFATYVADIP